MTTISFLIIDGSIADNELMIMLNASQHLTDIFIVIGKPCLFNFLSMKLDVDIGGRFYFLYHNLHDCWTVKDNSAIRLLEAECHLLKQKNVLCCRCEYIINVCHHHSCIHSIEKNNLLMLLLPGSKTVTFHSYGGIGLLDGIVVVNQLCKVSWRSFSVKLGPWEIEFLFLVPTPWIL